MDILFEDEQLLVLNKPAGLPVLPDGWEKDAPYLVEQLEVLAVKLYSVQVSVIRVLSCLSSTRIKIESS